MEQTGVEGHAKVVNDALDALDAFLRSKSVVSQQRLFYLEEGSDYLRGASQSCKRLSFSRDECSSKRINQGSQS